MIFIIKLLRHRKFILMTGLVAIDALFFGLTNPNRVPSLLLIVGFGLVVATLYTVLRLVLSIGEVYSAWFRRQRRPVGFVTVVLAAMLALQSIGQLALRDVVVLLVLSAVLAVYYNYSKSNIA
jgi:uncharacterized protein (DUF3820 family)